MDENLLLSLIENNAKMEVVDLAAALNETEENVDKTIKDLEKNYILSPSDQNTYVLHREMAVIA